MPNVLVPFTTGVEEIELVAIVDVLRRADVSVTTAALNDQPVTGRSNIIIQADTILANVLHNSWDMIVLPGGLPNAYLLRDNTDVRSIVERLYSEKKVIAAICAAPTILATYGITAGKKVTAYPACKNDILELTPSAIYVDEDVVEDDFIITSQGAGTAIEFSLRLVAKLCGEDKEKEIRHSIVG